MYGDEAHGAWTTCRECHNKPVPKAWDEKNEICDQCKKNKDEK